MPANEPDLTSAESSALASFANTSGLTDFNTNEPHTVSNVIAAYTLMVNEQKRLLRALAEAVIILGS